MRKHSGSSLVCAVIDEQRQIFPNTKALYVICHVHSGPGIIGPLSVKTGQEQKNGMIFGSYRFSAAQTMT